MKYPKVYEAIRLLHEDQGLWDKLAMISENDFKKLLPQTFNNEQSNDKIDWNRVEGFLATLSKADLETFCIGDQDAMVAIVRAGTNTDGVYAHQAIGALFEMIGC